MRLSKRRSAAATESHLLHLDGTARRWRVQSTKLVADLAIAAVGEREPVAEWLGCRGSLARVPAALEGTLAVRTGKAP